MIAVRYEGFELGHLDEAPDGWRFSYDPRWLDTPAAFPASLLLPLRPDPFDAETVARWIASRAPIGVGVRGLEAALPAALGAGEAALGGLAFSLDTALTRSDYGAPAVLDENGVPKAPEPGAPATHFLKYEDPSRPGDVENRFLCAALAEVVGFDVAPLEPRRRERRRGLVERRSDRLTTRTGAVVRLHAEDCAQALGRPAQLRSDRDGPGVSLADLFALADAHFSAEERLRLLDAVILHALLGDPDADAKRYRLLLSGGVRLAPLVDLATAGPWRGRERRLAHRFPDRDRRPEQLHAEAWRRVAEACRLNRTFTLRRVVELGERLLGATDETARRVSAVPELEPAIVAYFAKAVREIAARVVDRATRAQSSAA